MGRGDSLGTDMVKGAIAGAIATWAMDRAGTYLYELEDEATKRREEEVRQKAPFTVAAEKLARLTGASLGDRHLSILGQAINWGIGIGAGALYDALRHRMQGAGRGQGLAFGTAFFLLGDELLNWALGLSAPPSAYPWQAHARGLATHLAYGLVAETSLELLDQAA